LIRSHVFHSSGEAYDASQTSDAVRDGDVLLVPSEGRAAVLVGAWPVAVGTGDPGAFHALDNGKTFRDLKGGRYLSSAIVAIALSTAEGLKAAGMGVLAGEVPRMHEIARQQGWSGEFPEQERYITDRDDSWGAG
jgi:hypothetical protein